MDIRELVQQLHHAVIILERVQPHPRQAVFSGDQVLIERLMLMPEHNYAQDGHQRRDLSTKHVMELQEVQYGITAANSSLVRYTRKLEEAHNELRPINTHHITAPL